MICCPAHIARTESPRKWLWAPGSSFLTPGDVACALPCRHHVPGWIAFRTCQLSDYAFDNSQLFPKSCGKGDVARSALIFFGDGMFCSACMILLF